MGSLPELQQKFDYPSATRDETVIDNYHGVLVSDPYRWLEDVDATDVKNFVEVQRALTEDVLSRCDLREKLRKRITSLFDFPRYDGLIKRGNKYFYFHNTGLQAQSVLYTQTSVEDEAEILLDPNKLSDDGTVALALSTFSENGEYLAVGIRANGSDWINIKVMKVADKALEPDSVSWVKFSSISWTHDHKGFFYSRYPAPNLEDSAGAGTETDVNLNHQLYYHVLGTDQSEDILCLEDTLNPNLRFESQVTHDGKYLVVYVRHGCDTTNKLYYYDLSFLASRLLKEDNDCNCLPLIKLVDNFDAQYDLVTNDSTIFTFLTNKDAPRYKLVRVDLKKPDTWLDVIPESSMHVMESVHCVNGNQLIVCYLRDVKYILEIRDLETGNLIHVLPLEIGSVYNISGRRDAKEVFFSFTSFLTPGIIYKCDLEAEVPRLEVFRESIVHGFDRNMFQTSQVFAESKDGTKVPMFLVSRKGLELKDQSPALLFAYGGFNISITPFFSVSRIIFAQHCGGIFAIANIRGGGEYGEEWHNAGRLANKQNCFDDFISCAEFLVNRGYTIPAKLCIEGGSNGGLLVAACVNQRPDLFACALAHVGVMDMLRFHRFTIGHAWTTEFGCSDNEEEFHWLIKYSPLHNVRRPWESGHAREGVQYPAMMLLTADHDDRVVPLHSLKLLATLQYELCTKVKDGKQTNPIIGRIETKAGHGGGKPTQKLIEEATDKFAFLTRVVDAQWLD